MAGERKEKQKNRVIQKRCEAVRSVRLRLLGGSRGSRSGAKQALQFLHTAAHISLINIFGSSYSYALLYTGYCKLSMHITVFLTPFAQCGGRNKRNLQFRLMFYKNA